MRRLLVVALVAALPSGCLGRSAQEDPTAPTVGRGEDAAALPAFADDDSDASAEEIERFKVVLGDAPTRGPEDAPVTIVMFSDFECPYCRVGHETMAQLETMYAGKIRFAYKPYPLPIHSQAIFAALAARSAQAQGKFWSFHDKLFNQEGLATETLMRYASESGMDTEALSKDLAELRWGPEVVADMRQARRLGVNSTPTFFVNGRELSGAQPVEVFTSIIESELELAEQWKSEGVAPRDVYEHAIADGFTRVEFRGRERDLDPDAVYPVPVGDSPSKGPATAPVTIVAFGDFECPYCARGHATMESVIEHYGQDVRLVYKHSPLPFHSYAFLAARASVAAHRQDKFWAFHDALYARKAEIDEKVLYDVAKEAGLNMRKFDGQMNDLDLDAAIEDDQRLAAALGVTGTPAYFINGRPIAGAQPEIQFRLMIEEELRRADALRKAGTPEEKLYEALTHAPLD